jgi:hypothetical protein
MSGSHDAKDVGVELGTKIYNAKLGANDYGAEVAAMSPPPLCRCIRQPKTLVPNSLAPKRVSSAPITTTPRCGSIFWKDTARGASVRPSDGSLCLTVPAQLTSDGARRMQRSASMHAARAGRTVPVCMRTACDFFYPLDLRAWRHTFS